jgi:hypothetical protein
VKVGRKREAPMATYEIRVRGRLPRSIVREFERLDLSVWEQPVETVLNGAFEDQSALYGMLRQLEGIGLELVELRRSGSPAVRGDDENSQTSSI